jgi:hypothetical protein
MNSKISKLKRVKIRGYESAFNALCSIDPDGKWWTVPTLCRELRTPRQTVRNWVMAWMDRGLVEKRESSCSWNAQYRRTEVRHDEDQLLPAPFEAPAAGNDKPTGYDPYAAAITRYGVELVAVLERRRDDCPDPRFRLQALAVLNEFGCTAPEVTKADKGELREELQARRQADENQRNQLHAMYQLSIEQLEARVELCRKFVLEKYGQAALDFPTPPKTLEEYDRELRNQG